MKNCSLHTTLIPNLVKPLKYILNFIFINRCGEGHHPLMNTIKQVLGPEMTQDEKAARRKSSGLSEKNINQVQLDVEEEVFRT